MSQVDVASVAAALAAAVYKPVGRNGPGPFKLARESLYSFSERKHFRDSFLAELADLLLRQHSVHMLDDGDYLCFIHSDHLHAWRTMPRRQLVVPRP